MLEFFSILLVQVARFALASSSSSISDPPLDCLSAEQLCLSIQNCLLAWEAHRASCGFAGAECKSSNFEACHSSLVGLQTSAAFNRSCLCLKNMDESRYNRCRDVRQSVFYHPCIPIIKDKFYELYYASPKSDLATVNDHGRRNHSQHHIRHHHHKLENGDLQHRERVNINDNKNSRETMQKLSSGALPKPVAGPLYPSDEPPKHSGNINDQRKHNDNDDGGGSISGVGDRKRSKWNKSDKSCTSAFRRCQRHAACQKLWDLYRDKCSVQSYQCLMTDRRGCQEAYDGIQWTGLNTCHCEDDHSLHGPECHWIELLTSHNKCIDELIKNGYLNGNGNDINGGYSGSAATPPIASHPDYDEALETVPQQVTRPAGVHRPSASSPATPGYKPAGFTVRTPAASHSSSVRTFAPSAIYPTLSTPSSSRVSRPGSRPSENDPPRRRIHTTTMQSGSSYDYDKEAVTETDRFDDSFRPTTASPVDYVTDREDEQTAVIGHELAETPSHDDYDSSTQESALEHVTSTLVSGTESDDYYYTSSISAQTPNVERYETRTAWPTAQQQSGRFTTPTSSVAFTSPSPYVRITSVRLKPTGGGRVKVTSATVKTGPSRTTESSRQPIGPITPRPGAGLGTRLTSTKSTTTTTTTTTPIPTTTTTKPRTMPPDAVTMGIPTLTKVISAKEVALGNTHYRIDSTCQRAHAECRWDKNCAWQLSEMEISCGGDREVCNRSSCAVALRRFAAWVKPELQEAVTFCTCKTDDVDCLRLQKSLFPTCMFTNQGSKLKSCHDLVSECREEPNCGTWADKYFDYCKFDLDSMRCTQDPGACRLATMKIRGSPLENDCYCEKGDEECQILQSTVYFRNPCFEEAKLSMIPKFTTKKITTSTSTTTTPTTTTEASTTTSTPTTTTTEIISTSADVVVDPFLHSPPERMRMKNTTMLDTTFTTTETYDNYGSDERPDMNSSDDNIDEVYIENQLKPFQQTPPMETTTTTSTTKTTMKKTTTTPKPFPTRKKVTTTPKPIRRTTTSSTSTSTTTTSTTSTSTTLTTTTTTPTTTTPSSRCRVTDVDARTRLYVPNTYFRDYEDSDYRCSTYCQCLESLSVKCSDVFCLPSDGCKVDKAYITSKTVDLYGFNSVNYLINRGRCTCSSNQTFVCQYPERYSLDTAKKYFPDNGLFLGVGYSAAEYEWLAKKISPNVANFFTGGLSQESFRNQLQEELNKILSMNKMKPSACKVQFLTSYTNYFVFQIKYYQNETYVSNGSETQACSKPVKMLFDKLDKGILRDDLILSVVKQAIVENNLPASSAFRMNKKLKFIQIFDFFLFYILPFIILLKKWCSSTNLNLLGDDDVDAVLVNIETFFIEKSCLVVMIFVVFGFR